MICIASLVQNSNALVVKNFAFEISATGISSQLADSSTAQQIWLRSASTASIQADISATLGRIPWWF